MTKTAEERAADKAAKDAEKAAAKAADSTNPGPTGTTPDVLTPKAAAKASVEPITVKYRDHEGKATERTFSKDAHGEGFATLADEFKTTNAARLITE
jgi:hypothetical protein